MEQSRIEDQIQSSLDGQTYELPEDPLASRLEKLIQELINKGGGGGGGTTITVDSTLSLVSKNPVQNKVITEALNELQKSIDNIFEIPDMGIGDANDIFDFTKVSGTSAKYRIGIYREGSQGTPDSTKDWLIISFIGPAPDYISDQIALIYGGTEKPEVYLRAYASGTWTGWGKISGDVKENSATDDGIVKKGTGNQWNFWGTNQSGDPDWRTPLYLALQNQLSVYQDPSANTTVTGPNRGIKASTVTNEVLKQDGFTIDQVGYQDGLVLAFTNSMSQMSEILFTWGKGNVYYRVKATVSDWSDWVLIASKDPLLTENSKDKDGIVPKGNNNIWKIWGTDQNGNPGWRDSLYTKIQSFSYPVLNGGMAFNPTTGPTGSDVSAVKFFKVLPEHFKALIVDSNGKPFEENNVNGGIGIAYIATPSIVETVISSDTSKMYSHNRTSQTGTGDFSDWIELATVSDIDTAISNLIDGAPETLDTLNELAQALKDNQDVVDVLNDAIANKVDKIEGKGLSTNDYTDADKAAANAQADWNVTSVTSPAYILNKPDLSEIGAQSDWNVTATTSPAYILNKPGVVTQTEDGFVNAPGNNNPFKAYMTNKYGYPGWQDLPNNRYNRDGVVSKPNNDPNQYRPQSSTDMWKSWCIPGTGESDPAWGYPRLMGGIENSFDETLSIPGTVGMYENFSLKIDNKTAYGCLLVIKPNLNQTTHVFFPQKIFSDFGIWYRVGKQNYDGTAYEYSDWTKIQSTSDIEKYLPLTGGVISTDGMELEINGFGITGNEAQDITGFDVIKAMNLKGDMIFYNNQDTDKRYIKTDSLPINTSTISGAVLAGVDNPNKIWGTDQNGNPGWVDPPSGNVVENNTAEKAGIVAAGNTADSKSSVWGLDSDWNPIWKRLQELMIVDGTTPLTTEVDRVRFIKRYRWAVGLDTDETSTRTCYVLDLGGDTEGNQINFIFDYDYDLLENRGVYARYPIKDIDGDWTMSPPVKLAFSSDVSSLISEAVTELESKIDLKADIDSPALTGTPTAPTPDDIDNSTRIATTAFVKALINALVNGAPETLDTLKEVADAIAENETVVEALNAAIGNKVDKVAGKGLSTNDFTNEDKSRVDDAVLISKLMKDGLITDPNIANNFLSLINGWDNNVINCPSFINKSFALLISTWIYRNSIEDPLKTPSIQFLVSNNGMAYREHNDTQQKWGDWNIFDKRNYLPLSGGTLTGDLYLNQPARLHYRSDNNLVFSEIRNNNFTGGLYINAVSNDAAKELPEITVRQFRNNVMANVAKLLNKDGETEVKKLKVSRKVDNTDEPNESFITDIEIGKFFDNYFGSIQIRKDDTYAGEWYEANFLGDHILFKDSMDERGIFRNDYISTSYLTQVINVDSLNTRTMYTLGISNFDAGVRSTNISLGTASKKWKEVYAVNGAIQTSDRNEKNSFVDLSVEKAEALIYGLKPTTYMMNSGSSGRIHWGLISQDLEELLELIGWTSLDFAGFIKSPKMTEPVIDEKTGKTIKESEVIEGEYTYSLRYDEFIAPIIKVEQSHNERIKELEAKVSQQDLEIAALKSQIEELKNLILGGGN